MMSSTSQKPRLNEGSTFTVIKGADYSFSFPDFTSGTLTVRLIGESDALGTVNISAIIPGNGPETLEVVWLGKVSFNGSTGYSTIKGPALGEVQNFLKSNSPYIGEITIVIPPGFQDATLSLSDSIQDVHCKATKIITGPGN